MAPLDGLEDIEPEVLGRAYLKVVLAFNAEAKARKELGSNIEFARHELEDLLSGKCHKLQELSKEDPLLAQELRRALQEDQRTPKAGGIRIPGRRAPAASARATPKNAPGSPTDASEPDADADAEDGPVYRLCACGCGEHVLCTDPKIDGWMAPFCRDNLGDLGNPGVDAGQQKQAMERLSRPHRRREQAAEGADGEEAPPTQPSRPLDMGHLAALAMPKEEARKKREAEQAPPVPALDFSAIKRKGVRRPRADRSGGGAVYPPGGPKTAQRSASAPACEFPVLQAEKEEKKDDFPVVRLRPLNPIVRVPKRTTHSLTKLGSADDAPGLLPQLLQRAAPIDQALGGRASSPPMRTVKRTQKEQRSYVDTRLYKGPKPKPGSVQELQQRLEALQAERRLREAQQPGVAAR